MRDRQEKINVNKSSHLQGFGGVLILIAVGLGWSLFSQLFYVFESLIPTLSSEEYQLLFLPKSTQYEPVWGIFMMGEVAITAYSMMILIVLIILMARNKKSFKTVAIVYLAINVAISVYNYFILNKLQLEDESIIQGAIIDIVKALAIACLIILYLLLSKRVKNTYIK